jgi:hypothetical protein
MKSSGDAWITITMLMLMLACLVISHARLSARVRAHEKLIDMLLEDRLAEKPDVCGSVVLRKIEVAPMFQPAMY